MGLAGRASGLPMGPDPVLGWPQAELWAELVWLWPLAAGRKRAEGLAYTYIASIT